jgi:1,4-alpha-glucan branching enzyme
MHRHRAKDETKGKTMTMSTYESQVVRVEFPKAKDVMVLGAFNNWSTTATPMKAIGDGIWEVRLPGTIAAHQVCFVVWEQRLAGRVVHYESKMARTLTTAPDQSLPPNPSWAALIAPLTRAV